MAYTKINWQDGDAGGTPISAANLNHMDEGIKDAHAELDAVKGYTDQRLDTLDFPQGKGSGLDADSVREVAPIPDGTSFLVFATSLGAGLTATHTIYEGVPRDVMFMLAARPTTNGVTMGVNNTVGDVHAYIRSTRNGNIQKDELVVVNNTGSSVSYRAFVTPWEWLESPY